MEAKGSTSGAAGALTCEGVCLSFAGFPILREIDFALQPGRIHAITGENGAGKSSLAKVLSGIYRADSGMIRQGPIPIHLSNPKTAQDLGIYLIHQEPLPFEELSILENIFCGHLPTRRGMVDWTSARRIAGLILDRLGLKLDLDRKAAGLSIADQQMLELAAALSQNARYLIFDETTAPLTPVETENLFRVIRALVAENCAIGIVSHHMHEVFEISDEITVLRDGVKVAHLDTAQSNPTEVIHLMVGREFEASHHRSDQVASEVALQVHDLCGPGFESVSFEVRCGEVFGLVGLVGAGRTEVLRSIFGTAPIHAGEMVLEGQAYRPRDSADAIRSGLALVPEDRRISGLFSNRTVRENTTIVSLKQFLNRFKFIDHSAERSASEKVLGTLKTAMRSVEQPVSELSGGNQQKVILGRWLFNSPRLLILDEPTRGVDIGAKADVHRQIQALSEQGVSILVVSSDLPEVIALCHRVGVMRKGRLVGTLQHDQLSEEKIMEMAAS